MKNPEEGYDFLILNYLDLGIAKNTLTDAQKVMLVDALYELMHSGNVASDDSTVDDFLFLFERSHHEMYDSFLRG